ncbi:MAG: FGGY-family carbohydrate kinase [Spirochaetales bacterium]|uniref:FGGY-family carbohydrate kinase n=1 Tax=Candidatus Thalassospirochaeta sargassi TaxID=3119039 RepID=A0AAJ1ICU7_9SPIO|nr:FGGY-family carbohydrate kinase [Spirochaetales bacterium]
MKCICRGEIIGRVTAGASKLTGLPEGLPVAATANDKAVEALGSGLIEPNIGLLSLGTYTTAMVFGSEYRDETENVFTNLSSVPHQYLYECAGIRGGMWHISWILELLGKEFADKAVLCGCSVEELLEQEAVAVPAGSDGLLIVPDWLAPADKLHKKGVMIGFDQRHTRGHIYRAMMEALAMRMKNNFDAMNKDLGSSPEQFIVCGGGSNSDLFMQIIADVFGVTALRNRVNGAAGLGSAICAAVGTGYYGGFNEAVQKMVHQEKVFTRDEEQHKRYKAINEGAYKNLTAMLSETLQTIHNVVENQSYII